MTAAPDLPTVETLDAISKRLGVVTGEIQSVVWDVNKFHDGCKDDEGHVVTVPTLEQLGALHSFRELLEIDRDELAGLIETLAEKLTDVNLTRLDAAVQRA